MQKQINKKTQKKFTFNFFLFILCLFLFSSQILLYVVFLPSFDNLKLQKVPLKRLKAQFFLLSNDSLVSKVIWQKRGGDLRCKAVVRAKRAKNGENSVAYTRHTPVIAIQWAIKP